MAISFGRGASTIENVVKGQKKLENINANSFANDVPKVLIEILDRLCNLRDEGTYSSAMILNSFIACEKDGESWTSLDEEKLNQSKLDYNKRFDTISKIKEPRYLAQLLLDFFEELSHPVLTSTFLREFDEVLKEQEMGRAFINGSHELSKSISHTIYHTLSLICKSLNSLIGGNPDESKLKSLRFVLFRISICLRQAKVDHLFYSRNLIIFKEAIDMSNADKLTQFLYLWVTEYKDEAREHFKVLSSPLPTLHKKIISENGTSHFGVSDKFISKGLNRSSIKMPKERLSKLDVFKANHPQITEEDDGIGSPISEMNIDDMPEDIQNYLPVFLSLSYEEQNQMIKMLNDIMMNPS